MRKLKAAFKSSRSRDLPNANDGPPLASRQLPQGFVASPATPTTPTQPGLILQNEVVVQPTPAVQQSPDVPAAFPGGVKVWHDCRDAAADICFIHGLTGDRDSTWTTPGQYAPWPQTMIPPLIGAVRILTYGYDAYLIKKSVASLNQLQHHAFNFVKDLVDNRTICDASGRPVIIVAHSLGGIVTKEALMISRNHPEAHFRDLFDCVRGVIFMGTPHKGAWLADWAKIPASFLGIVKSTNISLLKVLQTDSEMLEANQNRFLELIRSLETSNRPLKVTCFVEELPLLGFGVRVVDMNSGALPGWPAPTIHADHKGMVRFASTEDNGFKRVVAELMRWQKDIRPSAVVSPTTIAPSPGGPPAPPIAPSFQGVPDTPVSGMSSPTAVASPIGSELREDTVLATPRSEKAQNPLPYPPPMGPTSPALSTSTAPPQLDGHAVERPTMPPPTFSAPSVPMASGQGTSNPAELPNSSISEAPTLVGPISPAASTYSGSAPPSELYSGPVSNTSYAGPVTNTTYAGPITQYSGAVSNHNYTVSGNASVNHYHGGQDVSDKLAALQVSLSEIKNPAYGNEGPRAEELLQAERLQSVSCMFCENCKSGITYYSFCFLCMTCKLWLCQDCSRAHLRTHTRVRFVTGQWIDTPNIINREEACSSCGNPAKAKMKCAMKDCALVLCISCAVFAYGKIFQIVTAHQKQKIGHSVYQLQFPVNWLTTKSWKVNPCSCQDLNSPPVWHHCERCHLPLSGSNSEETNMAYFCVACWGAFGLVQFMCKACFMDESLEEHVRHKEQHYFVRIKAVYDTNVPTDDTAMRYWDVICNKWLESNEWYTHTHAGMEVGPVDPQRLDYMAVISPKTRDMRRIVFYKTCDKLLLPKGSVQHQPHARDPNAARLKCIQCTVFLAMDRTATFCIKRNCTLSMYCASCTEARRVVHRHVGWTYVVNIRKYHDNNLPHVVCCHCRKFYSRLDWRGMMCLNCNVVAVCWGCMRGTSVEGSHEVAEGIPHFAAPGSRTRCQSQTWVLYL